MYAHFYRKKGGGYEVIFTRGFGPDQIEIARVTVTGKREARTVAAKRGAVCWNF